MKNNSPLGLLKNLATVALSTTLLAGSAQKASAGPEDISSSADMGSLGVTAMRLFATQELKAHPNPAVFIMDISSDPSAGFVIGHMGDKRFPTAMVVSSNGGTSKGTLFLTLVRMNFLATNVVQDVQGSFTEGIKNVAPLETQNMIVDIIDHPAEKSVNIIRLGYMALAKPDDIIIPMQN